MVNIPFTSTYMATLGVPGLEGLDKHAVEVAKGGETHEWMNFDQRKLYTNAFIVQDGKVEFAIEISDCDLSLKYMRVHRSYWAIRREASE